jgi:hypothetical protein
LRGLSRVQEPTVHSTPGLDEKKKCLSWHAVDHTLS